MQYIGLILSLEKEALQLIKTSILLKKHKYLLSISNNVEGTEDQLLSVIRLDEFASVMLQHMNSLISEKSPEMMKYFHSNAFFLQMVSIISVFDAVDVDSRGVISFPDFIDFCLRMGSMLLKPNAKRSSITYFHQPLRNPLYPSHKMKYIPQCQVLLVLDSDNPRARIFSNDGKVLGRINPIEDIRRFIKIKISKKITYQDKLNYEREAPIFKLMERDLDPSKGFLNDVVYIEKQKELVFSCSHSYLIFLDIAFGISEFAESYKIAGYIKTRYPPFALHYSSILDLLFCFPGEGSDHVIEVYDSKTRTLRFELNKHDSKILAFCEVALDKAHPKKDHYIISSSIDKRVIMWPTSPLTMKLHRDGDAKRMLRVIDTMDYELKGHYHAIQSLVYAPQQEMIFGCGFDFEIIAWDPFSRDVCMKFVGHFKSMVKIDIVYVPNEKLLSIDESGVIKLWNISKDVGLYGEQECSVTVQCSQPAGIKDFCRTHDLGRGIAVLAEKVFFFNLEGETVDDLKPVLSGLGICPNSGRIFTVFRTSVQLWDIVSAKRIKRIAAFDPDRISSGDVIISKVDDMKMSSLISNQKKPGSGTHSQLKPIGTIDISDVVTAIDVDIRGKKVFIGTNEGRVLLFDSFTFGLLRQLTSEEEDDGFKQQGNVIRLKYVERDELVVAAYANGAVKIFGGCHRGGFEENTILARKINSSRGLFGNIPEEYNEVPHYPGALGGKPPPSPLLLRECDLGVVMDLSVKDMAVCISQNLIAVLTKYGQIFLYDYLTLEFLHCIVIEEDNPQDRGISLQYISLTFVPMVPILLISNNLNHIIAWSVRDMGYKQLLSFNIYQDLKWDSTNIRDHYGNIEWNGTDEYEIDPEEKSFQLNTGANLTFITAYTYFNPQNAETIETAEDILKISHSSETSEDQRWLLFLGNEEGQLLTLNITNLIFESCADFHIRKSEMTLPVYQKSKPKRYAIKNNDYSTTFHRANILDTYLNKINHPLRKNSDNIVEATSSNPFFKSSKGSHVKNSLLRGSTFRQSVKVSKRTGKIDKDPSFYIQYLFCWNAYQRTAIRGIDFYQPLLDYRKIPKYPPTEVRTDITLVNDKFPYICTLSDHGSVRFWTFDGRYMGQSFDEGVEEELEKTGTARVDDFLNNGPDLEALQREKESLKKEEVVESSTLMPSSTFITSIITEGTLDQFETKKTDNQVSQNSLGHRSSSMNAIEEYNKVTNSLVYVRNEQNRAVLPRKVSITMKLNDSSGKIQSKDASNILANGATELTVVKKKTFVYPKRSLLVEDPPSQFVEPILRPLFVKGWYLPQVHIPISTSTNPQSILTSIIKRDGDLLPIDAVGKFSFPQFAYLHSIVTWVLPYFENEMLAFYKARNEQLNSQPQTLPKTKSRQTMIIRQEVETAIKPTKKFKFSKNVKKSKNKIKGLIDNDESEDENKDRYILSEMTEQEMKSAEESLKVCNQRFKKRQMDNLIDYIQQNDYFPVDLKHHMLNSHAFHFKNYDNEMRRNNPFYLNINEDLSQELVSKELSKQMSQVSIHANDSIESNKLASEEIKKDFPSTDLLILSNPNNLDVENSQLSDTKNSLLENTKELDRPLSRPKTAESLDPSPRLGPIDKFRPYSANNAQSKLLHSNEVRPRTAPIKSIKNNTKNSLETVKFLRTNSANSASFSFQGENSPNLYSSRPNSSLKPSKSLQKIDRIIDSIESIEHSIPKINKVKSVDHFMVETGTLEKSGLGIASYSTTYEDIEGDQSILRAESYESWNGEENGNDNQVLFINEGAQVNNQNVSPPVSPPGSPSQTKSKTLTFCPSSIDPVRLLEITNKYEHAVSPSKDSMKSNYSSYDPLRKRKELEVKKIKQRMRKKMILLNYRDFYIDDDDDNPPQNDSSVKVLRPSTAPSSLLSQGSRPAVVNGNVHSITWKQMNCFDDIVDIEHINKLNEKKKLLIQTQNALNNPENNSSFGNFKSNDILRLYYFLNCIPKIQLSQIPCKYHTLYYYDDKGMDFTKYVRDQWYYRIDDIIIALRTLISDFSALESTTFYQDLIHYRDEKPGFSFISLFHFLEKLFSAAQSYNQPNLIIAPNSGMISHAVSLLYLKIFMFIYCLENFQHDIMEPTQPPKQFNPGNNKNQSLPDNTPPADVSKLKAHLQATISTDKQINKDNLQSEIAENISLILLNKNFVKFEGISENAEDQDGQEAMNSSKPMILKTVLAYIFKLVSNKGVFVVKPHPTRGFRQWIVKRKTLAKLVRTLNIWSEGNLECLNLHDFIDIFNTLVPRNELSNFRIMRSLPGILSRLGLRMATELTGDILVKILETALEMKIVSQ